MKAGAVKAPTLVCVPATVKTDDEGVPMPVTLMTLVLDPQMSNSFEVVAEVTSQFDVPPMMTLFDPVVRPDQIPPIASLLMPVVRAGSCVPPGPSCVFWLAVAKVTEGAKAMNRMSAAVLRKWDFMGSMSFAEGVKVKIIHD